MLVVCAIIAVITMVLLFRQSKFDSSTVMRSLAYSIALSVRQAQVYGISVVGTGSGAPVFAPAYGVDVGNGTSYIVFADLSGNNIYDSGYTDGNGNHELVQTFNINNGYTISEVCAIGSGVKNCSGSDTSGTGSTNITYLDIVFKRPNPDAIIVPLNSSHGLVAGTYGSGYIQIKASDGTTRSIRVYTTGEMSVEPPCTQPDKSVTAC